MKIKRGTVWPWDAMTKPPDGWEFQHTSTVYLIRSPIGIVALRDHSAPPALPVHQVDELEKYGSKQGNYFGHRKREVQMRPAGQVQVHVEQPRPRMFWDRINRTWRRSRR